MTRTATSDLLDGVGVPFADVRTMLPERTSDWKPAHRISLGGLSRWKLFDKFHATHGACFLCGGRYDGKDLDTQLQAHHFLGPNRSDELSCLAMGCRFCHRERVSELWLPRWTWAKWNCDLANTDWLRATIVRGSWLDAPEAPPDGSEVWPITRKVRA